MGAWQGPIRRGVTPTFDESLHALSHTMWCSPCPITRRGAVVGELNRTVRRDIEHFCRVEARARLGWAGYQARSCCPQHQGACHDCTFRERRCARVPTSRRAPGHDGCPSLGGRYTDHRLRSWLWPRAHSRHLPATSPSPSNLAISQRSRHLPSWTFCAARGTPPDRAPAPSPQARERERAAVAR